MSLKRGVVIWGATRKPGLELVSTLLLLALIMASSGCFAYADGHAASTKLSVTRSEQVDKFSELLTEKDLTSGWTQCGTCEWQISNKVLTIRPIGNGRSGTLGTFSAGELPWRGYDFESVEFENEVKAQSCSNMFSFCESLRFVDLSNLDTSEVTDFGWMFSNCSSLASLDLSPLNTSNATEMDAVGQNPTATEDGIEKSTCKRDSSHEQIRTIPKLGTVNVYRLYNSMTSEHLWTTSYNEYQVLNSMGWKQEGVAFYAIKVS